ncbi:Aste57867_8738 [Aphanomyces stellatus]|uniref:Aste57867_8738 protein n=1 Tax=Aphanomyces stellatus TaxID=120398 RepID=A0A485KLF9_9STRA|nr:hypothetical protein As57867_008704 [Aphanomyces stellatus]VFT85624.1 Aste57867_8738 [Aphanomyces stellatus]
MMAEDKQRGARAIDALDSTTERLEAIEIDWFPDFMHLQNADNCDVDSFLANLTPPADDEFSLEWADLGLPTPLSSPTATSPSSHDHIFTQEIPLVPTTTAIKPKTDGASSYDDDFFDQFASLSLNDDGLPQPLSRQLDTYPQPSVPLNLVYQKLCAVEFCINIATADDAICVEHGGSPAPSISTPLEHIATTQGTRPMGKRMLAKAGSRCRATGCTRRATSMGHCRPHNAFDWADVVVATSSMDS